MARTGYSISVDFLEHPERRLFHVLMQPEGAVCRGSILFLHPFAEEMHKARRNVSGQARALAAAGFNVMLLDLTGCGDGDGDFSDATWALWLEDVEYAFQSLRKLHEGPRQLWGLRLGALLACQFAHGRDDIEHVLLWQPVLNGEQQIDQFLRLQVAAGAATPGVVFDRKSLWGELRNGNSLEIAGYELSAELALNVAKARLLDLSPPCRVSWVEIGGGTSGGLAPASQNVIAHWQEWGVDVAARSVPGEPFWRNHDAAINAELQRCSMELLT